MGVRVGVRVSSTSVRHACEASLPSMEDSDGASPQDNGGDIAPATPAPARSKASFGSCFGSLPCSAPLKG